MDRAEIIANLPPLHQKVAVTLLALGILCWMVRRVRHHRVHEGHALLWFAGIGLGLFFIWCDPLLVAVTAAMGVAIPASSLMLLAILFLLLLCIWLTSIVSMQDRRIARLIIEVSILKEKQAERDRSGMEREV